MTMKVRRTMTMIRWNRASALNLGIGHTVNNAARQGRFH
jgi:hypothetical protein